MYYYKYSDYLRHKYGKKIYKIPISVPSTCPNRDGTSGVGGCIFCSDQGAGFETISDKSIQMQLKRNISYIGKKYNAQGFIAYFQDFTATHMPVSRVMSNIMQVLHPEVVEVCLSTRPDCIEGGLLEALSHFSHVHNIEISIELGLQSINDETLKKINRGHSVACFIDAVERIKTYNMQVGVHIILNLPWDSNDDLIYMASVLNDLKVDNVKIHNLYVLKGTPLADMYLSKEIKICSIESYFDKIALFLSYLNTGIAIQRFFGRAPQEETLFCNWGRSWRFLQNELLKYLSEKEIKQGLYLKYE